MATHYNVEQQAAIDSSATTNVIISAGAGSGKTEVLSQKVFQTIVRDHIDPSSLLVLTFTNKAAFEMKERIIQKFQADPNQKENARKMLSSHVQTFDSFSLYLVKKYSNALGLPDTISLVDESLIEAKREEILDQILQEHYEKKDVALLSTLKKFDLKSDHSTKEILLDLDKKLNSLLAQKRKRFIDHYDEDYLSDYFFEECFSTLIQETKDEITKKIQEGLFLLDNKEDSSAELLDKLNKTTSFPPLTERNFEEAPEIQKRYNLLLNLLKAEEKDFLEKYQETMADSIFDGRKTKAKKAWGPMGKLFFKVLADALKNDEVKAYFSSAENVPSQILHLRSFQDDIHVLFSIIKELDQRLFEEKKLTGAFVFSDISSLALSLLEEDKYASIREEIQNRFSFLLVDEYQDTNDFQEEFLTLLSKKATLFVVGDAKQSIYAFRNSDCQLFLNRKDKYKKDNIPDKEKVIEMNTNYRSVKAILDDVNTLFKISMTPEHGGIDYLAESEELHYDSKADLYNPKTLYEKGEYGIHLLDYEDKEDDRPASETEALLILQDIKDKVEHHYQIFTGKGKPLRDCRYSDFAILLRNKSTFPLYQTLFRTYNVPLNNELGTSLKEIDAINVLESLLRLVSYCLGKSQENLVHLYASLARSFLYGKEKGYDDQKIYSLLSSDNPEEAIKQDPIYLKVEDFASRYSQASLSTMFLALLNEFGLIEKLPLVGDSEGNVDKMESFYTMILAQEAMGEGLEGFIHLFHSLSKFQLDLEANSVTEIKDAVTLETIHKSKGLQYPIVYLPVSQNHMSGGNQKGPSYIFSKTYGLLFPYHGDFHEQNGVPSKTFLTHLYEKGEGSKKGEVSEFIRLLYVALTRPKETAYIVGHEKVSGTKETLYRAVLKTFHLKMISLGALKNCPSIDPNDILKYQEACSTYKDCYKGLKGVEDQRENAIRKAVHEEGILPLCTDSVEGLEEEFKNTLFIYYASLLKKEDAYRLYLFVHKQKEFVPLEVYAKNKKRDKDRIQQEADSIYDSVMTSYKLLKGGSLKADQKKIVTASIKDYLEPLFYTVQPGYGPFYDEEFAFPIRISSVAHFLPPSVSENTYPIFYTDEREVPYQKEETSRASKEIVHQEADAVKTESKLERGTYLHSLLENVDFHTKDVSFIPDDKDKALIQRVLSLPIYKLDNDDKVYTEYGYFDPENETTGFIDCMILRKKGIDIIDYKLKNIDDEAYKNQLETYRRNIHRLYPEKEIHTYLLSILQADLEEVK